MIRLFDATMLAYTKLKMHKIRTGLTVGISGILFGILLAAVLVVQGIFTSIESFGKEGLNDRSIVAVGRFSASFNAYTNAENPKFIDDVLTRHNEIVARKTAAAKKYSISYDARAEDPSPVTVNPETGKRVIEYEDMSSAAVQEVADLYAQKDYKPFPINEWLASYPSAKILNNNSRVSARSNGTLEYMQDGKEKALRAENDQVSTSGPNPEPSLMILNQSVAEPFISNKSSFDPMKGEIPVILPFKSAEKLLGLKPLGAKATTQEKYDRLQEVRNRVGEATASFCYRSAASMQLVQQAESQRKDFEKNGAKKGYVKPAVTYKLLSRTSCDAVEVESDTRTAAEKQAESNYIEYQKEIGTHAGEPVQYKITVRGVGLSKDIMQGAEGAAAFDISSFAQSILGSWLGYNGEWSVPADMLKQVPVKYRPAELFAIDADKSVQEFSGMSGMAIEEYMVEFGDPAEARSAITTSQTANYAGGEVSAFPFGSSALLLDEVKNTFMKVMLWALLGVGGAAIIILGSMIGRTVADGRREGAVFRAIGARRGDIGRIYVAYTVLLSLRVVLFATILGVVLALTAEFLGSESATLGARYAYASVETPSSFHFFGVNNWLIAIILGSIVAVSLIASIIPILRSVRRNPIKDMRDDT